MGKISQAMRVILIIMIILSIVLVVLVFFLVRQSLILRHEQILNARELMIWNQLKGQGPPTPSDVVFIRTWMTFDYINKLFNVPAPYLQTQLSISDSGYPQMTLSGYARSHHLDANLVLQNVQRALRGYLTEHTATSTKSTLGK